MIPSPVNLSTVPPYRSTTTVARLTSSIMISRSRSAPTAAAISIECTTSANSTVTCLYSADRLTCVTPAPHSLQNLEFGGSSVPQEPQNSPVAGSPPPPSPPWSTSVSCHRWSTMSVISPRHLRYEVLRLSYVVLFRDSVQFASSLVDLVACIGHHGGGRHRLAVVGQRFVGLVAEDLAEVGDCGVDFGVTRVRKGSCGESADGGRLFVVSQAVE